MLIALILLGVFAALGLFVMFKLSLFFRVRVESKPYFASKVLYRIVYGDFKALVHEQSVYTKRARSLWRKQMLGWPTFRIIYPKDKNYGVFGIVVPNNFEIDGECLQELGFIQGTLDYINNTHTIEIPVWSKLGVKLNRIRCDRALYKISKDQPIAEFRNWKRHKSMFVLAEGELSGLWVPQGQSNE